MTHAYLPAKKVSEACRLEHLDFEQCLQDDRDTEVRLRELIKAGTRTPEWVASTEPHRARDRDRRLEQMHRARCLKNLADAAGEGTVAVDIEDFNSIAEFYRRLM